MSCWDALDDVVDSRDPSVAAHVRRYLRTDGADGYLEGGVPNLVLTVVGRRSGRLLRTALFFGEDAGRFILVASGSAITRTHPGWYLNLVAKPEVHVQVRDRRFVAVARTAEGEERERLWRKMTALAPVYQTYYAPNTPREIPVVILEPRQEPAGS